MEIAKLKEENAKLEKALAAHRNLQSSGEYLSIKQQVPDFPYTPVFDKLFCMTNWGTQISIVLTFLGQFWIYQVKVR